MLDKLEIVVKVEEPPTKRVLLDVDVRATLSIDDVQTLIHKLEAKVETMKLLSLALK